MSPNLTELVTIGVYGWNAEAFFAALGAAGVDSFCDVRARRGVRGSDYSFANSQRLQARLAELRIRYLHLKELAPDPPTRRLQRQVDEQQHAARRKRSQLSAGFVESYQRQVLTHFDSAAFVAGLPADCRVVALFCVEGHAAACHRSLLAARLAADLGLPLQHLEPSGA